MSLRRGLLTTTIDLCFSFHSVESGSARSPQVCNTANTDDCHLPATVTTCIIRTQRTYNAHDRASASVAFIIVTVWGKSKHVCRCVIYAYTDACINLACMVFEAVCLLSGIFLCSHLQLQELLKGYHFSFIYSAANDAYVAVRSQKHEKDNKRPIVCHLWWECCRLFTL